MNSRYQPASFSGVPFFVSETTDTFGRRGAHHEFPYRDRGLWDDLGGKDGERSIEGYLTSWSPGGLTAARAALIRALQKGEGELVHPWLGRHKVICTNYEVKHSAAELGVCRLSMTFIDADAGGAGAVAANPAAALLSSVQKALDAAADLFELVWSLQGVQGFVAVLSLAGLGPVWDTLGQAFSVAGQAVATIQALPDMAKNFLGAIGDLPGGAVGAFNSAKLPATAADLSAYISSAGPGPGLSPGRALVGLAALAAAQGTLDLDELWRQSSAVGDPDIPLPASTALSTARIRANLAAARFLGLSMSGLLSAALLTAKTFDDYDQAAAVRLETLDRFDRLVEAASDLGEALDFERALSEARGLALALLADKFPTTGRRARREFAVTLPSVIVAYELFEGLEQEPALVAGNMARHPGFMPRVVDYHA